MDNPVLPNYLLNIPNPAEQLQKSLQAGMQIGQGQQQAQAAQDVHAAALQDAQIKNSAIQQQQIEQQRKMAFQQDFVENATNPTPGGTQGLIAKYPQYLAEITGATKAISAEEAKQLGPIHISGLMGARDVQADQIKQLATSYLNSKDPQQQAHGKSLMDGLKLQSSNPGAYDAIMGHKISEGIGGEEYSKQYGGVTKLPAEILAGNSDASIKALDARHEEQKLTDAHNTAVAAANSSNATTDEKAYALKTLKDLSEFNRRKVIAETEKLEGEATKAKRDAGSLSEVGGKQYAEAYKDFNAANTDVNRASILANKIRTEQPLSGAPAKINKYWHQLTGTPDATARLNQNLSEITSGAIVGDMAALGRITPAEIALFSKARPDDDASASDKADWLDAYVKVMTFKREQALAKTKHIAANGDLTPMKRDTVIDGKLYKAGSPPPGLEAPAPAAAAAQGAVTIGPVRQAQIQRAQAHLSTLDPKSPEAAKLSAKLKSMGV